MHLNQRWKDRRLAFRGENLNQEITLSGDFADRIWVPDTFCANEKSAYFHEVTEKNKMIRLKPNGEVLYGMRLVHKWIRLLFFDKVLGRRIKKHLVML